MADRRTILAGGVAVAALAVSAYLVWGPGGDGNGDGDGDPREDAQLAPGTIAAVDFEYLVDRVSVASGDVLTFENRGPSHHTLTADDGRFDSGVVESGDTFTITLDGPREIVVHCEIHPSMHAVVVVSEP